MIRALATPLLALALVAAEPPVLRPKEGLAFAESNGNASKLGEASALTPMGDLAGLLWLRLEGFDWASRRSTYSCSGKEGALACTTPKGHGRVDIGKAFEQNCRLALLSWVRQSAASWSRLEGEAAGRLKVEEAFGPFAGSRFPKGDKLPAFDLAWVGEGDLLRSSPEQMAAWLVDPAQDGHWGFFKRYGSGFFEGEVGDFKGWVYLGRAEAGGQAWTWVAGGQSGHVAVLRMPGTLDRAAALKRFREAVTQAQAPPKP
jgi:hypothetical protein